MADCAKSAEIHDALNSGKDYAGEAKRVAGLIDEYKSSDGDELLEVACGTGLHAEELQRWSDVKGLELANPSSPSRRRGCRTRPSTSQT